jgi:exodeoxyribonuclease V alpha subunit
VENNNNNNDIIKVRALYNYKMFPKGSVILGETPNNYGITNWTVTKVIEGDMDEGLFESAMPRIVVTGEFFEPIKPGVAYIILAKKIEHEKYGEQYQLLKLVEDIDFSKVSNQKEFLRIFLTPLQIEEMFKVLENPLKSIAEHKVEDLVKVKGVGKYIADCIIRRFEDHKDDSKAYIELDGLGLTAAFIQKLIKTYKDVNLVVNKVKKNPYDLTFDVEGIGFKTADSIALKVGIDPKSSERIKGYINYILRTEGLKGNSYLYATELLGLIYEEFGGKDKILKVYTDEEGNIIGNNIATAMQELETEEIILIEECENKARRRVCLSYFYNLEKEIAFHLKRLLEGKNSFQYSDWETKVKELEAKQGWEFTEEQKNGIKLVLDSQVSFITGGAGVGKSSLVSGMLSALSQYSFAQCSLSGKAAARLKEITGEEGYTIHRLLEYSPAQQGTNPFKRDEECPLSQHIIILDELSLVGGEIFLSLLKAIPSGAKLVMLGDLGQLESIGCLNLASDIFNSKTIPHVELTKVHRQAQKSGIITSSIKVRMQDQIFPRGVTGEIVEGELKDMIFNLDLDRTTVRDTIKDYFNQYYNSELVKQDIMKIQIISPVKTRGETCVFNLNKDIQEIVNPKQANQFCLTVEDGDDRIFEVRPKDKVMCITNCYEQDTLLGDKVDVFNGWMGKVDVILQEENAIVIDFPIIEEKVMFSIEEFKKNFVLGYASTTHKMQGSSSTVIIGALDFSTPPQMLTKEMLYTLITRAEKRCVIVGQPSAIRKAIENSGVSDKKTFLVELLDDRLY